MMISPAQKKPGSSPLRKNYQFFLIGQGISPVTIKNYLSDFNQFCRWFKKQPAFKKEVSFQTNLEQINLSLIENYKIFLQKEETSFKTANRRLSSLRQFCQFCFEQGWLKTNPAKKIKNLASRKESKNFPFQREKILEKFKESLEKEKISALTIKNYLSDIRHFLKWLRVAT